MKHKGKWGENKQEEKKKKVISLLNYCFICAVTSSFQVVFDQRHCPESDLDRFGESTLTVFFVTYGQPIKSLIAVSSWHPRLDLQTVGPSRKWRVEKTNYYLLAVQNQLEGDGSFSILISRDCAIGC